MGRSGAPRQRPDGGREGARLVAGGPRGAFFSAAQPVALVRIPGAASRLLGTPDGRRGGDPAQPGRREAGLSAGGLRRGAGLQWYVQDAALGMRYVVALGSDPRGRAHALRGGRFTATMDDPDPLALAKRRVRAALEAGWDALREPHAAWWAGFWSQSQVSVPEPAILRHYYLVRYFYGAASRRGAPPMPLQGVWTADTGGLPPWKGDYHNDLNTQMTYIAYQAAGHFDEGPVLSRLPVEPPPALPRVRAGFYGTGGLAAPGVMSLAGQPLGGWGQYSLSPTMRAWNAHLFYLHWRYTVDDAFLRDRAYPWCREVGECLLGLLKPDANGILELPLAQLAGDLRQPPAPGCSRTATTT